MPRLLLTLTLAALLASAAHCAPAVFWASDPIAPGETVLLAGGGFGDAPKIEVKRLPDGPAGQPAVAPLGWSGGGEAVPAIQPSDTAVKFTLPAALKPGLFACRVTGAGGAITQRLNAPALWWAQGDLGLAASPGGTLRLFGKNLLWAGGPKPTVVLAGADGGPAGSRPLQATGDAYALTCALPANLKPGAYTVSVHAGYGGGTGWSAPLPVTLETRPPWPTRVYSVRDHGATGDGASDDTAAIQTALDAAGQAGGGVVFFPRGRYQVRGALTIPRYVVLRGEAEDLVSIFWPDMETPPPALLQGTNSFGLQELCFYCSNYKTFLAADTTGPDAGDVFLHKVRVRADVFRGHMKPEEVDQRWREGMKVGFGGGYWLLKLGGRNLSVTDCDLYSASCIYSLTQPRGAVIARNLLYAGRWGGSGIFGGEGIILADNKYIGADLMSWGAAGGLGYGNLSHLYLARNSFALEHGGDRESITSDASGGIYYGPIASCSGTTLTLPEAIKTPDPRWLGAGVFILNGTGHGQWRRAVGYDGDKIELDRPWDLAPDRTSIVSVVWLLRQWLLLDNSFSDVGISIQLYGSALEHICAGNTTARSAGFHNFGMNYHGLQPSWYIQWLGNEISEGNAYSAGHDNYMLAGDAHLGVFALPKSPEMADPLTYGCVVRHNRLLNNAHIAVGGTDPYNPSYSKPVVQEVVVERNEIADSQIGVFVRRASSGIFLRDNQCTRVVEPVRDEVALLKAAAERREKLLADPGPLGYWSFEKFTASSVPDATGHGFDLSISGKLTPAPGHVGQAGVFDGHSWLTSSERELFNLTNLTLSLWLKPDTIKGRHGLIGKRFAGAAAPFVLSLWDGSIDFEACDTTGKWSYNFHSPAAVKAGEWSHVAAVVQQGQGVTIYVNGQPVATKENAAERTMNMEPLVIGREAWAGVNMVHEPCWYQGLLDEIKVFGRALTAEEVRAEAGK
jgi:hypothetical protein